MITTHQEGTMFRLEFETGNDAFTADDLTEEVSRIMRSVLERIGEGRDGGIVRDSNGNSIGSWSL